MSMPLAPGPPAPPQIRPRGIAFLIPAAILLLGLIAMVLLIINGFRRADRIVDDFDRVAVEESETFDLEAGDYRVWIEGEAVDDGFEFIDYSIVSTDDATPVTTSPYDASLTYDMGDRTGSAFETFELDEPGEYEVSFLSTSSGRTDRDLAIGQDNPVAAIGAGFAFGALAAVLGFIVALAIAIVLFVRRSRSRKAQTPQPPPAPQPPPGYGYGYPPQPPPQWYPQPQPQSQPQPQEAAPQQFPPPG
jgi:hypothetical protein